MRLIVDTNHRKLNSSPDPNKIDSVIAKILLDGDKNGERLEKLLEVASLDDCKKL